MQSLIVFNPNFFLYPTQTFCVGTPLLFWVLRPRDCFCNLSLSCSKIEYVDRGIFEKNPSLSFTQFSRLPHENFFHGDPYPPQKLFCGGEPPQKPLLRGPRLLSQLESKSPLSNHRRAPGQKRYRIFYLRGPPYEKNLSFGHCVRYCSRIRSPSLKFFSFPTKASFCGSPVLYLG